MNIDLIKRKTATKKISYFQSIDSTNSYLLAQGECGEVCISDEQSAGRGRRGNIWVSPNSGNLYFSLCWCFDEMPEHWSLLGLVVAIAIAETLEELGLRDHGIKWPNDIFWRQRKMGGILLETLNQSGKVVIGIGLNLKMEEEDKKRIDQASVTLAEAMSGKGMTKDDLVIVLIKRLYQHLHGFNCLKFDHFVHLWNKWDILYGEMVSLNYQGKQLNGQVSGLDLQGRLGFVEENKQETIFFSSADIKLSGLKRV